MDRRDRIVQPTISLCMVVKNEEMLLRQCLKSVKSAVDEIVIVDTGSKDRTIDIAKKFGVHIIPYKWDGDLGRARNVSMRNATGSWILVLDADERIAKKDLPKLKKLVKDTKTLGYILTIRNYTKISDLLCDWHSNDEKYPEEERLSGCPGWSRTTHIRLFRRLEGIYYKEGYSAHSYVYEQLKKNKGAIKECNIVIHHFQYLKGENFVFQKQMDYLKDEIKSVTIPKEPWNYLNIGITLFSLRKYDKAIKYLKKAIKLNPRFDMVYFILGMAYNEKAMYKDAIFHLKKAIKINPEYADAWTVLGMIYDNQGRLKEAENVLKKAINIHPYHPLAHNSLGIVYKNQGRLIKAEKEYKKAIRIHPQHPKAYYNLALLYQMLGKHEKAWNNYRIALRINKLNRKTMRTLVWK